MKIKTDTKIYILAGLAFLIFGLLNFMKIANSASIPGTGNSAPLFSRKVPNKNFLRNSQSGIFLPQNLAQLKPGLVPVLMYHHVGELPVFPDAVRRDLTVSIKDFNDQIAFLDKEGYHSISTAQLELALRGQDKLPAKPVILSFDDGYNDVFQNAVPILKEHHMAGAFAIITGFVGRPGYAAWSDILAAQKQGMEMVCHSQYHMDFTNRMYTHDMKVAEISDCKQALQANLGIDAKTFIYPYGHFDSEVQNILKNSGFELAFTTQFGIVDQGDDFLALPRLRVHGQELLTTYANNLLGLPEDQIPTTRSNPDKSL
jgi:peptidoglycan/xylan/chitin deacetylase (PgdA/CDA1 family)